MCCFARSILRVAQTRIFARLTGTGSQFLAYQMKYESAEPNAMILPLPVAIADGQPPVEDALRFIDLSEYESFFGDLDQGFPYIAPPSIGCALAQVDSAMANLAVHQVGSFVASFVPSLADFDRLDPQFVIPKETWDLIPAYTDYGFAVFQLKELAGKPHPMAFEFPTRMDKVFFPTVHIHDGEVHDHEDFDHELYLQHAGFDSVVGKYRNYNKPDRRTGFVRSQKLASAFCDPVLSKGLVEPNLLVHRTTLKGRLENSDRLYAIAGDPLTPSANWSWLARFWPWMVMVVAVTWFFNRRGRLRKYRHRLAGSEQNQERKVEERTARDDAQGGNGTTLT